MPQARIHFGIPFYAGADYLREALESVLQQTLEDWTLTVHDDSADGDARAVVAEFEDRAGGRMRWFKSPPPAGMVANWNRCLDGADEESGEAADLVTILHQDDRLLPSYAASMVALSEEHEAAAALFCGARIIDGAGAETRSFVDSIKARFLPSDEPVFTLRGEPAVAALLRGNFIMCPTVLYRRSVIGERRFEPRWKQVQDLAFTTRLLMEGESLVGTREELYAYRRHAENATVTQSASLLRYREEYALYDELHEQLGALGWGDAARVARARRILKLHLGYDACANLLRLRFGAAARRIGFLVRPRADQTNKST